MEFEPMLSYYSTQKQANAKRVDGKTPQVLKQRTKKKNELRSQYY